MAIYFETKLYFESQRGSVINVLLVLSLKIFLWRNPAKKTLPKGLKFVF